MATSILNLGMESLSYQKDSRLKKGLVSAFADMRAAGKVTSKDTARVEHVIKETTGISIKLKFTEGHTAFVMPPMLDKNNPIITGWRRKWHDNSDTEKFKAQLLKKGSLKGAIDYKTGKVTGFYSDVEVDITLGKAFITDRSFSVEEIAAVIGHELGHTWTYFHTLGTAMTTDYAIASVLGSGDDNTTTMYSHLTVGSDGRVQLLKSDKPNTPQGFAVRTMREAVESERSALGSSVFDRRGCEVLADQFAARHGFGVELVTSLDKLNRKGGIRDVAYLNDPAFYALQALTALSLTTVIGLGLTSGGPVGAFVGTSMAIMLITNNPQDRIYDDTPNRARKLREQIVNNLKVKGLDKRVRKELLAQLEVIDKVNKNYKSRSDVYDLFFKYTSPARYDEAKRAEQRVKMEKLMNSEMFVQAAKLKR